MTIDRNSYASFLEKVAEDIDIPPGRYKEAVDRYGAVGHWLEEGQYPGCAGSPDIYPQGSFRLGTVVRPHGAARRRTTISISCASCRSRRTGRKHAR